MIRLATIGTGQITHRMAATVQAVDGIELTVVYSRDHTRATRLARTWNAATATSDLPQLLASPGIDAVYIASPNSVHYEQTLAALRAGKHVLVEKPATPTATQWHDLTVAARSAGVVLLEAIRTEYDPGIDLIRSMLPLLGPIRRASLRYQKRSSRYDQVRAGHQANIFDATMAGGALMDLGVYCAHALITIFGPPQHVAAATVPLDTGVDGAEVALAVYPGFIADLAYSKITTSTLPSEIQGEEATLLIDHIASPRLVTLQRRDGTTEEHSLDQPQHNLIDEVRRFVQLIRTGGDMSLDHDRTHQALQLLDAIRTSRI